MKKPKKVICKLFGDEIGNVVYFNEATGEVGIKYKGSKYECSAYIKNCLVVK